MQAAVHSMASLASASPGGTPSQQQQPVTAMQQQQQQPQNQQQQQQAQQATPAGQPQAPAEPGFFGRMFRRQKPGAAAGAPAAGASAAAQGQGQQQAQVADAPTSAGCCAKKWTAQDEQNAEKLRQAPVNASRCVPRLLTAIPHASESPMHAIIAKFATGGAPSACLPAGAAGLLACAQAPKSLRSPQGHKVPRGTLVRLQQTSHRASPPRCSQALHLRMRWLVHS